MAVLNAWQTVKAVRRPGSRKSHAVLVVTRGVRIRDRLRALQPKDPDSYYASRELVPNAMLRDLERGTVVVSDHQVFLWRETLPLSKGGRAPAAGSRARAAGEGDRREDAAARHAAPDGHEADPGPEQRGAPLLPREAGRGTRSRFSAGLEAGVPAVRAHVVMSAAVGVVGVSSSKLTQSASNRW
jgi:hypothetical protein